jgi:uncharacterized protein
MSKHPKSLASNYVTRVHSSPLEIDAAQWNALLAQSPAPTPFMRHEYLAAMHSSGSAVPETGWTPQFIALYAPDGQELLAACPMYLKAHSYGEYVFDWAWARAYQEHGLRYYPKALVAVPFTPVPGSRFLVKNPDWSAYLLNSLLLFCEQKKISSLHALFASEDDQATCHAAQLMSRETVQFHWTNHAPTLPASHGALPPEGARFGSGRPSTETHAAPTLPASHSALPPEGARFGSGRPSAETKFLNFDTYLATLAQDKRKKIRAEQRKVQEAGIRWRWQRGADISQADWDFFYICYERTYLEHGNPPYLTRDFFRAMQSEMPENWLLFVAEHNKRPVACSLIALQDNTEDKMAITTKSIASNADSVPTNGHFSSQNIVSESPKVAYGRYWGAIARVDSLHFDACYYQPLQWCIEQGFDRFEGGAQGEHKMARGLLPVVTRSAHWLAQPQFADAVERFLEREREGIGEYVEHLVQRSPFRT